MGGLTARPDSALQAALKRTVAQAVGSADHFRRRAWVVLRAPLPPGDGLACFASSKESDRFYWERKGESHSIVALGCLHAIETSGPDRFLEAGRRAQALFERTQVVGSDVPDDVGPLLVGGFAFASPDPSSRDATEARASRVWSDFPAGRLVLPELLITSRGGQRWCCLTRPVRAGADVEGEAASLWNRFLTLRAGWGSGSATAEAHALGAGDTRVAIPDPGAPTFRARADRSHADFRGQVKAALSAIALGDLEKVVVARSIELTYEPGFDPVALLDRLRHTHPTCTTFCVARGSSVFLGSTPEDLVRVRGDRVTTAAVAGSAPRGRSPEEDSQLGRALCESKKEQAEHAIVVRGLREALAPCCRELEVSEAPRLLRLDGIQHLETPISGKLRHPNSVLELIDRIHPSPSVGGAPRRAACEWLEREEKLDRGWYAAPVGFVDRRGAGEFVVALRAAQIRPGAARLFAGAGVVEGSEPEAELRETQLKLRALMAPLLEI